MTSTKKNANFGKNGSVPPYVWEKVDRVVIKTMHCELLSVIRVFAD